MRKKVFLTLSSSLLIVFFVSYVSIFILFQDSLRNEIEKQQRTIISSNYNVFQNYMNSFDMIPFQLVNNEEVGNLLCTDSLDNLENFKAREAIKHHLQDGLLQLLYSPHITSRINFYINPELPLSAHLESLTLDKNIKHLNSSVYSSNAVSDELWYTHAYKQTWMPYFFLNTKTNEICYVKCVQNHYMNFSSNHGTGVLVISIPVDSFFENIAPEAVTDNSILFLLNNEGKILYNSQEVPIVDTDELLPLHTLKDTASGRKKSTQIDGKNYSINTKSIDNSLYLTYITPDSDINKSVSRVLFPFVLLSISTILLLLFVIFVITNKITNPIISFAHLIRKVDHQRSSDKELLKNQQIYYKDPELKILYHSFKDHMERENNLIEKINKESKAKQEATMHALQAQINPHFLYNALDIVSWMALSDGNDQIAEVVSSISNLMHYSISRPNSTVTIAEELENIQEYINIYQIETQNTVQLNVDISDQEFYEMFQIPKFILQPLIENSIMHNLNMSSINIFISFLHESDKVRIKIEDNGIGADPIQINEYLSGKNNGLKVTGGIGIRNVHKRIQLHYSAHSGLSYKKGDNGNLIAFITINLS